MRCLSLNHNHNRIDSWKWVTNVGEEITLQLHMHDSNTNDSFSWNSVAFRLQWMYKVHAKATAISNIKHSLFFVYLNISQNVHETWTSTWEHSLCSAHTIHNYTVNHRWLHMKLISTKTPAIQCCRCRRQLYRLSEFKINKEWMFTIDEYRGTTGINRAPAWPNISIRNFGIYWKWKSSELNIHSMP